MKQTYKVEGMTCNNCKASVEKYINALENVTHVSVHLENGETEVTMDKHISTELLKKALPEKFTLSERLYPKAVIDKTFLRFSTEEKAQIEIPDK